MMMLTSKRLLFLAGTLGQGGAERQLFNILKTLKTMGADPYLISLTQGEYWEAPIKNLGIPILWVGKNKHRSLRLKSIFNHASQIKPAIIQSQHFYTNLYVFATGRLLNRLDVGAIRSNGASEVKVMGRLWGKLNLYLPRYLAANSISGMNYAESVGVPHSRLRFLPNVVDTSVFTPSIQKSHNHVTLLAVSNFYLIEKRLDLFIELVYQLKQKTRIPISAIIVGDGPLRSVLEKYAMDRYLYPGTVEFLGSIDNIEKIYQGADILISTSEREGTPNAVMEAMSSGLPVVATKVGGVPDLVQDGSTGFLTDPGDLDTLISILLNLIDNPEMRKQMGEMGREYMLTHHSLVRLPDILSEFYFSLGL